MIKRQPSNKRLLDSELAFRDKDRQEIRYVLCVAKISIYIHNYSVSVNNIIKNIGLYLFDNNTILQVWNIRNKPLRLSRNQ